MTPGVRIHVVMPPDLVERIDSARGEGQSRGDWVRRAVERALEESGAPGGAVVSTSSPAPAEQPENRYVSVYPDRDENAELPPASGVGWVDRDAGMPPYRPRRDVKPFQRGES